LARTPVLARTIAGGLPPKAHGRSAVPRTMSGYTNRIEGFGCDGAKAGACQCPAGHQLKARKARAGACGACRRPTRTVQDVMGCQRCNWYICSVCLPPTDSTGAKRPNPSSNFSQLIEVAKQEFSKALSQTDALVSGLSCRGAAHAEAVESEIQVDANPAVTRAPQRRQHTHCRDEEQEGLREAIRRSLDDADAGASLDDEERDLQRAIALSLRAAKDGGAEVRPAGSGASSSSGSADGGGSAAAPAPEARPAALDDLIDLGQEAPADPAEPEHRHRTIEEELLDVFSAPAPAVSKADCGPAMAADFRPAVRTAELGG